MIIYPKQHRISHRFCVCPEKLSLWPTSSMIGKTLTERSVASNDLRQHIGAAVDCIIIPIARREDMVNVSVRLIASRHHPHGKRGNRFWGNADGNKNAAPWVNGNTARILSAQPIIIKTGVGCNCTRCYHATTMIDKRSKIHTTRQNIKTILLAHLIRQPRCRKLAPFVSQRAYSAIHQEMALSLSWSECIADHASRKLWARQLTQRL